MDDLTCVTELEELDEHGELEWSYQWFRNGQELLSDLEVQGQFYSVTSAVLSHNLTTKNETWYCTVKVSDATGFVTATTLPVTIHNSTPTAPIVRILPENPTPADGLAVWIDQESMDPDGDPLAYLFEWFDSVDGITWRRRAEMSGNLSPFYPGASEISKLYTQAAEFWKVRVTPVELSGGAQGYTKGMILTEEDLSLLREQTLIPGRAAEDQVFIIPDLNGDGVVDIEDLLILRLAWKKGRTELPSNIATLFFEPGAAATEKVGLHLLLKMSQQSWGTQSE